MRIGIDARCLEWQRGGVARYLINMLKLWPKMTNRHQFVLYFQNRIPKDDFLKNCLFEHKKIRGPRLLKTRRIIAEQLLMPFQIRQDELDLFFATCYSAPLLYNYPKTVVAVWDISYTTHPGHYALAMRIALSFFSRHSCRRAAGVITCSPFDARQIERYYRISRERICTLQLAADDKFQPLKDEKPLRDLRRKYNLPNRYLLSLGAIYNRRNVDVIIDAFKDVYCDYPDIGLVVVGRNHTRPFVDIASRMKSLIKDGRGQYLPWIPEEEIVTLYGGAWYYICVSTVDGESIMLKEAMRCGTPVITSPLLEESVGKFAVILRNPSSRRETAKIFHRIIPSRKLRERCAHEGYKWVQQMSWTKVAQESLEFLETR